MTTITTGTSGPQAWKIALVAGAVGLATLVAVNLPQTTSDTTGQEVVQTATATLPESVTGFEYNNESTSGRAASPGVTTPYPGNSGELFPYENGPAPQTAPTQAEIEWLAPPITQQFLDGPSSAPQGAIRVDPRAAAAAGLNPGVIDSVVGGTTRVAPTPDSLADAQVRTEAAQAVPALSFAASDEALVNPVPEVNAGQLIQDIIDAERAAPAPSFAASDEALVTPVPEVNAAQLIKDLIDAELAIRSSRAPVAVIPANASAEAGTNARWGALHGAYHKGTLSSYTSQSDVSPEWQAYVDAVDSGSVAALYESSASDPLVDERVNGDPYLGGTSDDVLTRSSSAVDPADVKFLGAAGELEGNQRSPQQNVTIR
jgi:hypothetical protein